MANPAADFRAQVQANHPGATVAERGRNFIRHQHPSDPAKFILDTTIGPIHYGVSEDQEIDTAWQATTGAWDWEMTTNDWQTFARDTFNVGGLFQFEKDGESVTFDPQSINWIDENTSRQQIAIKQAVVGAVSDDKLTFTDAYKTGVHFEYHNQTARLKKIITIDNFAAIDTTLPAGNTIWFEAEFTISHSSGVEVYLDGVQWAKQNNVRVQTTDRIEFRDAATGTQVFWWLDLPQAEDSNNLSVIGEMEVRRDGGPTNLFITVRIPKTWIDAAVFPIFIDPTIDPQIGAGGDDFRWSEGDSSFGGGAGAVTIGNRASLGWDATNGFGRFTVTGPANGDTIDVSRIDFYVKSGQTHNIELKHNAIDGDDPAAPTTYTEAETATRTTASQTESWTTDTATDTLYSFASIVSVIQELIDRGGWSSGNHMVIYIEDNASANNKFQLIQSYDDNSSQAMVLHIEYTAAGGGGGIATQRLLIGQGI